jgi:hypothetical protein
MQLQDIYHDNLVLSEEQIASSEELVKQIQTRLKALALPVGTVDGIYGKQTDAAIAQFCKAVHLDCAQTNQYGRGFAEALIEARDIPSSELLPIWHGGDKWQTVDAIVEECVRQGLPLLSQQAYLLATVEHETAGTWQPLDEYGGRNTRYAPYWGRGYVQLTWDFNYIKYSEILGLDLYGNPEQAKRPDVALFILVHGCKYGTFTGLGVEDFINEDCCDYYRARKVINGLDRANEIAAIARDWKTYIQQ